VNRREFARSLTVIACAGAGPALAGFAAPATVTHFVHDHRIESKYVAAWVARLEPAYRHRFDGDVTALWRNVLNRVWRESHAATAGLTRHAEFFVLSTLARDQGYRVAMVDEQAEHVSWLLVRDGGVRGARDALRTVQ